ncbi:MAG: nucleotidyltransferase substrate binding protein [Alphaproteobacteria bacterium]
MKSELNIQILENAITTLKEAFEAYQTNSDLSIKDIVADSCVKRFEYTIETSIKIMKKYLKLEYAKEEKELTINNTFRFMQGYELIKNWENWRLYYAKRNDTSHEYNLQKARELLDILPEFIIDADFLLKSLKARLK